MSDKLTELNELKVKLKSDQDEKQHSLGKLTARERLEKLFDSGTFVETGAFVKHRAINFDMEKKDAPLEGVITGYGQISGKLTYAFSQDFNVLNGSIGEMHAEKISNCQKNALKVGAPIIGIYDCGGVRVEEGLDVLNAYGKILKNNVEASGVIPQIAMVMGNCGGILSASVAINDFVFMLDEKSYMYINGPEVINSICKNNISIDKLASAKTHGFITGIANVISANENKMIVDVKNLLTFLPQNYLDKNDYINTNDDINRVSNDLNDIVPNDSVSKYDMKVIINSIADNNYFYEINEYFAKSIITGFIRLGGKVIGVIANNTYEDDVTLDNNSLDKVSRFIRTCDNFGIPLLTLEDTEGFKVSMEEEHNGLIKNIAKLAYAYAEASVPLVTVITRKSYGGTHVVMCSKSIGADMVYAWPTAMIGLLGSEAAVNILYDKEIKDSKDSIATYNNKIKEYDEKYMNPYVAASRGYVDDIIEPRYTRKYLISAFDAFETKVVLKPKKKHGNMPL